jgi:lipocalin
MGMLINSLLSNKLSSMPQMQMFNQMMSGKNPEQQMQTILNMAKSQGFDINAKIITDQQARQIGLNIPRKG